MGAEDRHAEDPAAAADDDLDHPLRLAIGLGPIDVRPPAGGEQEVGALDTLLLLALPHVYDVGRHVLRAAPTGAAALGCGLTAPQARVAAVFLLDCVDPEQT